MSKNISEIPLFFLEKLKLIYMCIFDIQEIKALKKARIARFETD